MTGPREQPGTRLLSVWAAPLLLTARALVLGRDEALLPTLSLPALAVAVIRVPVARTHGSVSPVTDHTVAGAAGAAPAGQAHGTEPAHVWAPVWGVKRGDQTARGGHVSPHLGTCKGSMGVGVASGPGRGAAAGEDRQGQRAQGGARLGPPPGLPTLRLALARAHFLEEETTGRSRAAHDTLVVVGDAVIPAHGLSPGRAALRPQQHLRAPRAWVHAADAARVAAGALAGV